MLGPVVGSEASEWSSRGPYIHYSGEEKGLYWCVWSLEEQTSSYLTAILIWGKLLVSVDTHNLTHEVQIPAEYS